MKIEKIDEVIGDYLAANDVLMGQVRKNDITAIVGMRKLSVIGLSCLQRLRGEE